MKLLLTAFKFAILIITIIITIHSSATALHPMSLNLANNQIYRK